MIKYNLLKLNSSVNDIRAYSLILLGELTYIFFISNAPAINQVACF